MSDGSCSAVEKDSKSAPSMSTTSTASTVPAAWPREILLHQKCIRTHVERIRYSGNCLIKDMVPIPFRLCMEQKGVELMGKDTLEYDAVINAFVAQLSVGDVCDVSKRSRDLVQYDELKVLFPCSDTPGASIKFHPPFVSTFAQELDKAKQEAEQVQFALAEWAVLKIVAKVPSVVKTIELEYGGLQRELDVLRVRIDTLEKDADFVKQQSLLPLCLHYWRTFGNSSYEGQGHEWDIHNFGYAHSAEYIQKLNRVTLYSESALGREHPQPYVPVVPSTIFVPFSFVHAWKEKHDKEAQVDKQLKLDALEQQMAKLAATKQQLLTK